MRDDAPPECPRCKRPLDKYGYKLRDGAKEDDADAIENILYRCHKCKLRWVDAMDGTQLTVVGTAKKKS